MVFAFCISGCQDKKEQILGSWKSSAKSALHGKHDVFIFDKDRAYLNLTSPQSANYEIKDGKFFVHLDRGTMEVNFIDDNTIMFIAPGGQVKCVRITSEEAEKLKQEFNKTPSKSEAKDWKAF